MKSIRIVFWGVLGAVMGGVLGLAVPVAVAFGINAGEAATAFAIMLIVTIPGGVVFGTYAGIHRGRTGAWRGLFSRVARNPAIGMDSKYFTWRGFDRFNQGLVSLPPEDAQRAKQTYLMDAVVEVESMKPNYGLLAVGIIFCLFIPILIPILLFQVWRFHAQKNELQQIIRNALEVWSVDIP